jgi:site-specific recombinase XerC
LQKNVHANLQSENAIRADGQVWQAVATIAEQLKILANAQMGEGVFFAPAILSHTGQPVSLTLAELINEFLRAKARAGKSERYLQMLRANLVSFSFKRRGVSAGAVTAQNVEAWIDSNDWMPRTVKGKLGDIRTLFNFALRRGYIARNPALGVECPVCHDAPPAIHPPHVITQVLNFARAYDLNICRAMAIRYFAGLRTSEVERIDETAIKDGFIEVSAARAKTRRRPLVTIQPNLRAWLCLRQRYAAHREFFRQQSLSVPRFRASPLFQPRPIQ